MIAQLYLNFYDYQPVMKRQHPLITTFGIIATAAILTGLMLMVLSNGGQAFSPGELSAKARPGVVLGGYDSHAAFEGECELCHTPLETTQDKLCLRCHKQTQEEIDLDEGAHHGIRNVNQCAFCHHDHEGRDFDITHSGFEHYDHNLTRFSLVWHQVNFDASPMDCHACHRTDGEFALDLSQCAICHAKADISFAVRHTAAYGDHCTDCHDGIDSVARFDHNKSRFHVEGKHTQVSCEQCHGRDNIKPVMINFLAAPESATLCSDCHNEPSAHSGQFTSSCQDCHTPDGWSPARLDGVEFSHYGTSGFSVQTHKLDYQENAITCLGCHTPDLKEVNMTSCVACHEQEGEQTDFMRDHQARYSPDCLACHDGVDRMQRFDHNSVFPLEGRHSESLCLDCHQENTFRELSGECSACHEEPKIHAGFFGLNCQYCHTAQAWAPAQLTRHTFPIDHGGRGDSECKTCHDQRYNEHTCYGCHDHQQEAIEASHLNEGITLEELRNCAICHPTGIPGEAQGQG